MKKSLISDIKPVKQKNVSASAYSIKKIKEMSWLRDPFSVSISYLKQKYPSSHYRRQ
jgi:hypothetical protein